MKYLFIAFIFASCCGTKSGTGKTSSATTDSSYVGTASPVEAGNKIALYFGSMASGPIGDEFLKTWLQQFIKDQKATITADKFSACGKEGEYIILINKTGFTADIENKFTSGLKSLIDTEVKRAKAENASSGSVEIRENPTAEDYTYCRLGSKKWL